MLWQPLQDFSFLDFRAEFPWLTSMLVFKPHSSWSQAAGIASILVTLLLLFLYFLNSWYDSKGDRCLVVDDVEIFVQILSFVFRIKDINCHFSLFLKFKIPLLYLK